MGVGTAASGVDAMAPSESVVVGPSASDQPVLRFVITGAGADVNGPTATAGKIQRMLSLCLVVKTPAVDVTFESLTGSTHTALSGAMTLNLGQLVLPWNPHGHVESKSGEQINFHQSGTSQLSGFMTYHLVDPTDV